MSNAVSAASSGHRRKFNFLTLDFVLKHDYPPTKWVVEGLLPAEGMMAVSGDPGSYKTWLLMEMAIAVASGEPFLGQFATHQGAVMLVDEENPARLLQERFKRMDIPETELPFHIMSLGGFRLTDDNVRFLLKEAQEKEVKMIIFDSLVRIHDAEENDAKKMSDVFAKLKQFITVGISVVFIHHNRKQLAGSMAQAMRGSTDILASVDSHAAVRLDDENNIILMEQTKSRSDRRIPPIEIQVIHEEGKTSFAYLGECSKKTKQSKMRQASDLIATVLIEKDVSGEKKVSQSEIVKAVKTLDSKMGRNAILDALKYMTDAETIHVLRGEKNSMLYCLNKPEESEEPRSDSSK